MTGDDIVHGLRRARLISHVASVVTILVLLFVLFSNAVFETTTGQLLVYGSIGVVAALNSYVWIRQNSLRREQRRVDREEYRRLVSKQPTH